MSDASVYQNPLDYPADDAVLRARNAVDSAHRADPERSAEGLPDELVYADAMEAWLLKLHHAAPPLWRLAARCQHLERWTVARSTFSQDKAGYLQWRRHLYVVQADRAQAICVAAGISSESATRLRTWVAKQDLKTDPGSQALEDAACLVFLEREMAPFAAGKDYDEAKWIDIIRKTWRKMSPAAHALALTIQLPPALATLVGKALA